MRKIKAKKLSIEDYKKKLKEMSEDEIVKEFKNLALSSNPFDVKRRTDAILDEIDLRKKETEV